MNFNNILFLDIETVSQYERHDQLPEDWKELWELKAEFLSRNRQDESSEQIYQRSSIYAEFGKIVCISCGYLQGVKGQKKIVLKSFYGDNEAELLNQFCEVLDKWGGEADRYLCAHNGKEFDIPYLCRRMIIHGISLPEILRISGKRPWDIRHLDTMEMWKFGDYKSFTSLKLLAKVLGIPSPKDDIDGSMVNQVFWQEKDLKRIAIYCEKDVLTLARVFLRLHCEPGIHDDAVLYKTGSTIL